MICSYCELYFFDVVNCIIFPLNFYLMHVYEWIEKKCLALSRINILNLYIFLLHFKYSSWLYAKPRLYCRCQKLYLIELIWIFSRLTLLIYPCCHYSTELLLLSCMMSECRERQRNGRQQRNDDTFIDIFYHAMCVKMNSWIEYDWGRDNLWKVGDNLRMMFVFVVLIISYVCVNESCYVPRVATYQGMIESFCLLLFC